MQKMIHASTSRYVIFTTLILRRSFLSLAPKVYFKTSLQQLQGTSMFSQRPVPYILPVPSRLAQLPSNHAPPSWNFGLSPPVSTSRQSQSSCHTTSPSRNFGMSPAGSIPRQPSNHPTSPLRNVSQILPRLYISDLSFAENHVLLSSYRITHILSTLPDAIFRPPPSLLPNQPIRMQIELDDSPFAELAAYLPRTTSFIRDALKSNSEARVLVHCVEGVSRSVSVVAAYLMAEYGGSPKDAVEYIQTKRTIANPNFGFVQQLSEYARDSLSHSNSIRSHLPYCSAPLSRALDIPDTTTISRSHSVPHPHRQLP